MSDTTPKPLAALIERYLAQGHFTGVAVLAARQGELVVEHYAGQAAPGLLVAHETLWPIASISKVYTAAAIMRLVELGELTLNTPIALLLPAFRGQGREDVRLRHLLTHTAGMIYESPQMEQRLRNQVSLEDLLAEALSSSLLFAPGTTVAYADYHYLLAGAMAERATGTPFPKLLHDLIVRPMSLDMTFFPPAAEVRVAEVRGVLAEGSAGAMYNSRYARELAHPAFGVVSSARDMLRFAQHFMPGGPRVLAESTVRAMIRDQTGGVPGTHSWLSGLGSDGRVPWGIGWALQTAHTPALFSELLSFETFGHGGASGCQLVADPEQGLTLAVLTNTHLRMGHEPWLRRLQSLINCTVASIS
jgi:CubicO group peptidase (beta-lactamase class C family)